MAVRVVTVCQSAFISKHGITHDQVQCLLYLLLQDQTPVDKEVRFAVGMPYQMTLMLKYMIL